MKDISPELLATIQSDLVPLSVLVKVSRRDGGILAVTDYNDTLPFNAVNYIPGYERTAIVSSDGLNVNRFDVQGWISGDLLNDIDVRAGLYDGARVRAEWVNPFDLTMGSLVCPGGVFGEIQLDNPVAFKVEVASTTSLYEQEDGQLYSPTCRAQLGDARCKFVIVPDVGTVDVVSDDRRTFTATGAFHASDLLAVPTWKEKKLYYNRMSVVPSTPNGFRYVALTIGQSAKKEPTWPTDLYATVVDKEILWQAVDNSPGGYDDWYRYGRLVWTSGLNTGFGCEVQAYNADSAQFKLFPYAKPPFTVAPGDTFTVEAGCSKEPMTCKYKFDNMVNHRGEYLMLGQRKLLSAPGATTIGGK